MSLLDQFFVYHPEPWKEGDWSAAGGVPLEDVWFQAPDGTKLFGWYAEQSAASPVLLWCHGNAGNMIHRLDNLRALYRLGLSVFLFDYRGYGRSQGRPSENGLYQDAIGAYDYLTRVRRIRPERLVIFGRSLGRRGGRGTGDAAACHGAVAGVLLPFDRGRGPPSLYGFAAALVAGSLVSIGGSAPTSVIAQAVRARRS
jgi:fermentation-respiration switch protein FrsA (DUF1100 family)